MCLALGLGIAHLRSVDPVGADKQPTEGVVLTVGQRELTVAELSYYYWSEYHYYMNAGHTHLPEDGKDLDQQAYDAGMSWYDYFLAAAIETAREDLALCQAGSAEGFVLPEEWQTELDGVKEKFSEYAAAGGFFLSEGEPDLDGYLKSSYGAQAAQESFFRYLSDTYYAAAYADRLFYSFSFSDEQVREFFELHAERYAEEGLSWNEACPVEAAWALFVPETADESGWDAAYERAETMALSWHAAGGGEENFLALGRALSFDTAETAADCWQEPTRLLPSDQPDGVIYDWCFEPLRQAGDYTIARTSGGWALIFFCGRETHTNAHTRAEEDLRYETYRSELKKIVENTAFSLTKEKIVIAEPLQDEK